VRVVSEFVLRRLQKESGVRESRLSCDTREGFRADVSEADVPMPVNARVVRGARIVEVYGAHSGKADVSFERVERGGQSVFVSDVVAGGEGVRCIETDTEFQFGATLGYLAQVLEAVADALALTRSVFEKNAKAAKLKPIARGLQTLSARSDAVGLARAARAARVNDEIVSAERQPSLYLFAERGDRLLTDCFIRRGEVDEIVCVYDDGRDFSLTPYALEVLDLLRVERAGLPTARVAREKLNGVCAEQLRFQQSILQAARNRRVETDAR
jgi:hypothetical protein